MSSLARSCGSSTLRMNSVARKFWLTRKTATRAEARADWISSIHLWPALMRPSHQISSGLSGSRAQRKASRRSSHLWSSLL